jgi:hypothetical protein
MASLLSDSFMTGLGQEKTFRQAFLTTFRSFAAPDQVFDLLVEQYEMDHPATLTTTEFEEWKEKRLRPTQGRVLTVFTMWLEDFGLLEDEPHIAGRLTNFLQLILTPPSLALSAKLILQSVERLVIHSLLDLLSRSQIFSDVRSTQCNIAYNLSETTKVQTAQERPITTRPR